MIADETPDQLDDRLAHLRAAATAVAHTARPGMLRAISDHAPEWADTGTMHGLTELLSDALEWSWNADALDAWFDDYGDALTGALCVLVRDVDVVEASFLLGAAVQAFALCGADLDPDLVLRLAELAAAWQAGQRHNPHTAPSLG